MSSDLYGMVRELSTEPGTWQNGAALSMAGGWVPAQVAPS